jgi:hypothetical protein
MPNRVHRNSVIIKQCACFCQTQENTQSSEAIRMNNEHIFDAIHLEIPRMIHFRKHKDHNAKSYA